MKYNGLILSGNSHKDDKVYLNELLTDQNIGEVKDDKIIIFPGGNIEKIFYSSIQSGSEAFLDRVISDEEFIHYNFAPKVFIGLLEKFIARYVKAISACGVHTHGSCDGNHHTKGKIQEMYVNISGGMYDVWYKIICEKLLFNRFNFICNEKHNRIIFKKIDKWKIYVEVNRAAEFLYNNRIKIRQIRRGVSDEIIAGKSRRMINKIPHEELVEIFFDKANRLFDKFFKDI